MAVPFGLCDAVWYADRDCISDTYGQHDADRDWLVIYNAKHHEDADCDAITISDTNCDCLAYADVERITGAEFHSITISYLDAHTCTAVRRVPPQLWCGVQSLSLIDVRLCYPAAGPPLRAAALWLAGHRRECATLVS